MRKHFGSTELAVSSVKVRGRAGGEYAGGNVEVEMTPKKKDAYDK